MPTPAERKALIFLTSVIVLGGTTRLYRSTHKTVTVDPAAERALNLQISRVDSARASTRSRTSKKRLRAKKGAPADPPAVPAIIDLDLASADEIETLRGIGPALAAKIVLDRDSLGAFGSMEALQRVKGVGPSLGGKLADRVTFSGVPRPVNTVGTMRSVKKSPKRTSRRREMVN